MFSFSAHPGEYQFSEGDLYIGETEDGQPLGIKTKRHAITVAGSRTGKGVGVIHTNLRTWPHNALVIDPKGEAANVSWEARRDMGQAVHVLDPFNAARKVPEDIKASYNPLDDLDPTSLTIKEDIAAIADGTVMRANTEAEHWDNGAMRLLSGLIAYVLTHADQEDRNLIQVRRILVDRREDGLFDQAMDAMNDAVGGGVQAVMKAGAAAAYAKEGGYYISNAEKHTDWLDSDAMPAVLSSSSFSMRDLKRSKASVFIALPFKYLPQQQHGRFLRLMVRCGINAMQEPMPDGSDTGEECLFILDEFFSLGYIDEVATSIGGMAGYGLHLWPFLQDLDQLWKLYGKDGAGTFFGSSDLHQFFGITDQPTAEYVSQKIGVFNVDDLPDEPVWENSLEQKVWMVREEERQKKYDFYSKHKNHESAGIYARAGPEILKQHQQDFRDRLSRFQTDASRMLGKPRLAPDEVSSLTRLEEDAATAAAQVAFVRGGRPLICKLSRYFEWVGSETISEKAVRLAKEAVVKEAAATKEIASTTSDVPLKEHRADTQQGGKPMLPLPLGMIFPNSRDERVPWLGWALLWAFFVFVFAPVFSVITGMEATRQTAVGIATLIVIVGAVLDR
ncbi:MAG: type IV secretory system conjugative DNA transfer family protein, partial [Pseudomonadota bacterium]